jgi:hypothetical protein
MMDFKDEEEKGKFEIEETNESNVKFGTETANAPLLIVVQGGKNVNILFN